MRSLSDARRHDAEGRRVQHKLLRAEFEVVAFNAGDV